MMSCGGNVSLSSFEEKFDERTNTTTFCHQKTEEEEGAKKNDDGISTQEN